MREHPDTTGVQDAWMLQNSSALNYADEHDHDRDYQQDMNEATRGVRRNQSEHPQNQKNDSDSPKHRFTVPCLGFVRALWWPSINERKPTQTKANSRHTLAPWRHVTTCGRLP